MEDLMLSNVPSKSILLNTPLNGEDHGQVTKSILADAWAEQHVPIELTQTASYSIWL